MQALRLLYRTCSLNLSPVFSRCAFVANPKVGNNGMSARYNHWRPHFIEPYLAVIACAMANGLRAAGNDAALTDRASG
jgi:hypothetical protein